MSGKANRRTVRGNGREDPRPRQPNLTVTPTVTPKDGHPEHPGNKAKADVLSRPLDFTSPAQERPQKNRKKKAKRQPCIIPGIHRLYTVKEAASYLRLSPWTVRGLGWNGEIPEVKIGRRRLFNREDLDAFVERSKR